MMKKILFVGAVMALLSSAACAPATPTVDPAQIQASAVAAANTMVALTQAAIPTATEMPPTPLPSPTVEEPSPTPYLLPTLDTSFPTASVPTAPSSGTGGDPCNAVMAAKPAGHKTPLHIINNTKGSANISLYLSKTPFGECGFARVPSVPKGGDISISLPEGCYYPSAYINDPKHQSTAQGPSFCIKGSLKWTLTIEPDNFKVSPP